MKRTNPSITRPFRWLSHLVLLIAGVCISASVLFGQKINIVVQLDLSQIQLGIKHGGRANTIAVHPKDSKLILVASESGGLFRTENGGKVWKRIDEVPFELASVAFLPKQPNVALVTALEDFKSVHGGGGVWRSTDSGATWKQMPTPPGVDRDRLSAFEISIAPDTGAIYVSHASGIIVSQNDQGKTWKHLNVFPQTSSPHHRQIFSIVALEKKVLIAGGPGGVRRSTNGGSDWSENITDKDKNDLKVEDLHAFHHSQASPGQTYLAEATGKILVTEDAGLTWTPIKKPSAINCGSKKCGGIRFIKATRPTEIIASPIDLYYGNRCCTFRMLCPQKTLGGFDYSGKWQLLSVDHLDPRDIAFSNSGKPILLASDGGLHEPDDAGAEWTLAGAGKGGYNALQVSEVRGQYIEEISKHDLYFGTQDNGFWSSSDGGATWKKGSGSEGAYIQAQALVAKIADAKITYESGGTTNMISDRLFANSVEWQNSENDLLRAPPVIVRGKEYVQHTYAPEVPGSDDLMLGLDRTLNRGKDWQPFVQFNAKDEPRDIPKVAAPGSSSSPSILYQPIRIPSSGKPFKDLIHLARIVKQPGQKAEIFYPAMDNFAGMGRNPPGHVGLKTGGIANYVVYAVDPKDPLHVIAADVGGKTTVKGKSKDKPPGMMQTTDGGETWDEMTELTELVTGDGLLFMRPDNPGKIGWRSIPLVSAIAFSPQNPDLVLVGTWEGGLYLSIDNGQGWQHIEKSEAVTHASAIHWVSANEAIISTYGRGLWRVHYEVHMEIFPEDFCDDCFFVPFEVPKPSPVDQDLIKSGVFVFDGKVMGATVESGVLREVFVTPGSSVAFVSKDARASGIRVTRTNTRMGYRGIRNAPPLSVSGRITRGLVFDERMRLQVAAFGAGPASMFTPKAVRDVGGRTVSPAAGRPHLRVVTNRFAGLPATTADEPVRIIGSGFAPGSNLQMLIDEQPPSFRVQVNERGRFTTQFPAPSEVGMHSVQIRDAGSGEVLDGSMFLVTHAEVVGPRRRPKRR